MIKFINALTHTEMLVADERKEQYLAAGHKLAANVEKHEPQESDVEKKAEESTDKKKDVKEVKKSTRGRKKK